MSRLDLLKPGVSTKSEKPKKSSGRGEMLKESTQSTSKRKDDFDKDGLHLEDDDFENELEDPISAQDDEDEDDKDVNVIELDVDLNDNDAEDDENDDDDENQAIDTSQENYPEEKSTVVESRVFVDYSEDDIKTEIEYTFDHRAQAFDKYVKVIQDGGLEIAVPNVLHLGDIVRVSVTLSELKEQVGCEGRVISVFPQSLRVTEKKLHKYIIQFIGPNASETERVIYKYLLGYKGS